MAFAATRPPEIPRIALVDFRNDCVGTSLQVIRTMFAPLPRAAAHRTGRTEEARKFKLFGVRPDTSANMRDVSVPPLGDKRLDCGVNPRLVFAMREAIDREWQDWGLAGEDARLAEQLLPGREDRGHRRASPRRRSASSRSCRCPPTSTASAPGCSRRCDVLRHQQRLHRRRRARAHRGPLVRPGQGRPQGLRQPDAGAGQREQCTDRWFPRASGGPERDGLALHRVRGRAAVVRLALRAAHRARLPVVHQRGQHGRAARTKPGRRRLASRAASAITSARLRARASRRCSCAWARRPRYVGYYLQQYKRELGMVGGIVIILLGLHTAGILRIKWLLYEKRAEVKTQAARACLGAYVVGLAFALRLDAVHRPDPGGDPPLRLAAGDGEPGRGAAVAPIRRASASRSSPRRSPSTASSPPSPASRSRCAPSRKSPAPCSSPSECCSSPAS